MQKDLLAHWFHWDNVLLSTCYTHQSYFTGFLCFHVRFLARNPFTMFYCVFLKKGWMLVQPASNPFMEIC